MKKKLYFGWIVLLGCFISRGATLYFSVNSFSLFVTPVVSGLEISAAAFLVCATMSCLGGMLGSPIGGKLIDEKGIRFTSTISGLILVIGFVILGFAKSLPIFYVGYFIVGFVQGAGGMVVINAVAAKWFNKYRGTANGICCAGQGAMNFILSPILAKLIISQGFNNTYFIIAAIAAVLSMLTAVLLLRDDPADMGLLPDGAEASAEVTAAKTGISGLTVKEAVKTANFWLMAIAFCLFTFCSLGIVQTYNAAFQSVGFDAVVVAFAVSIYGLASIPSKIAFGSLTDKLPLKVVTVIGFALFVLSSSILWLAKSNSSVVILYVFAVLFAIGNGSWQPLMMKYVGNSFGMKNFGSINGILFTVMNFGGMIGPIFSGAIFDKMGSYSLAYLVFAIVIIVCALLLMIVRMPRTETNRSTV